MLQYWVGILKMPLILLCHVMRIKYDVGNKQKQKQTKNHKTKNKKISFMLRKYSKRQDILTK